MLFGKEDDYLEIGARGVVVYAKEDKVRKEIGRNDGEIRQKDY